MSDHLAVALDLELAWQRVKLDFANSRAFVREPYEVELVEVDLDGWLNDLKQQIRVVWNELRQAMRRPLCR